MGVKTGALPRKQVTFGCGFGFGDCVVEVVVVAGAAVVVVVTAVVVVVVAAVVVVVVAGAAVVVVVVVVGDTDGVEITVCVLALL